MVCSRPGDQLIEIIVGNFSVLRKLLLTGFFSFWWGSQEQLLSVGCCDLFDRPDNGCLQQVC